nr:hypothetical protein [Ruegeria pomeroyi]
MALMSSISTGIVWAVRLPLKRPLCSKIALGAWFYPKPILIRGGQFSLDIASRDEESYVHEKHMQTVKSSSASGDPQWAATLRLSDPGSVYRGAKSFVEGSASNWRDLLYKHGASKSYIFGERSLPNPDADVLPENGI